ncbi:DUF5675 family protein [Campylobacter sp. MOP7]|uniref:DUF5675 family protein n=1 Tax=Campylobacter canis TaxID=3378588 RepID=UPI00387EB0A0
MKLIIQRTRDIQDGTIGEFKLIRDDEILLKGFTLEPAGNDTTQRGKDKRIPAGSYSVAWHDSPRFKRRLPLLYNELVPKDRYILIHAGNYPKHTEGCILVGSSATNEGVFSSVDMLMRFLAITLNRELEVEIRNA